MVVDVIESTFYPLWSPDLAYLCTLGRNLPDSTRREAAHHPRGSAGTEELQGATRTGQRCAAGANTAQMEAGANDLSFGVHHESQR